MTAQRTVLFDLDGTLLDTAPDMANTLNQLRQHHRLPALPLPQIRPMISHGVAALLKLGFGLEQNHVDFSQLSSDFLTLYQNHATDTTQLFPEMEAVLQYLDKKKIRWGIVTNKPGRFTFDILKNLGLASRAACVVCGDTLAKRKPHPEPILHACYQLQQPANRCVYIGDSPIDVIASKAAGSLSLVALYGYIGVDEDPLTWHADGYIHTPIEIITWLTQHPMDS